MIRPSTVNNNLVRALLYRNKKQTPRGVFSSLATTSTDQLPKNIYSKRFFHTTPQFNNNKKNVSLGVLRETYDKWERRAPLTPHHVSTILKKNSKNEINNNISNVFVQPSSHRIFSDSEYEKSGAVITEDLSQADVILGVKAIKKEQLIDRKTYMMFSHVIKGQVDNMSLLEGVLEKDVKLVDYECITSQNGDNEKRPKRVVTFGRFAGIAGMNNILSGLGQRLLSKGYSTPFLHVPPAYMNADLERLHKNVKNVGDEISRGGLGNLEPLVFAFAGKNGNVTNGALEIFKLLPHEMLSGVNELKVLRRSSDKEQTCVYGIVLDQKDIVKHKAQYNCDDAIEDFNTEHFRSYPYEYESTFHENVAPYCHVLVNGSYWDERFPRLLTRDQMKELHQDGKGSLLAIADISCDIHGSIEFLDKTTSIEQPFFNYNPILEHISGAPCTEKHNHIDNEGDVLMMGVDILPTELAKESSQHFGDSLLPLLQRIGKHEEEMKMPQLPKEMERACIASNGTLSPKFKYIAALMRKAAAAQLEEQKIDEKQQVITSGPSILLFLEGHLFDTGLINQTLDILETHPDSNFSIKKCQVGPCSVHKSSVLIRVTADSQSQIQSVCTKIETLLELIGNKGDATLHYYNDNGRTLLKDNQEDKEHGGMMEMKKSPEKNTSTPRAVVTSNEEQKILILGAGRVASAASQYLGRSTQRKIIVASSIESEVQSVAREAKHGQGVVLDVMGNKTGLSKQIKESDVVISLLPATMHLDIAEECINHKKDLVTASYVSEDMKGLDERCREAGILILNEVGLDPGMDHMSAMKIMDNIRSRDGKITHFTSVCGGLPAPEAANTNALGYKFSWSPMGVLSACGNSATYRKDGEVVHVDGDHLLAAATPIHIWPNMQTECLPKRNSLIYGDLYGISNTADTTYRGTLRYSGFSGIMHTLKNLGLLHDSNEATITSVWGDVIDYLWKSKGHANLEDCLLVCSGGSADTATKTQEFLKWLSLTTNNVELAHPDSILMSFCQVLQEKLKYEDDERDMVLMHHDIRAEFDDGSTETHLSSLQLFGDEKMTAMCKTVGYTVAASTDLVLLGNKRMLDDCNKTGVVLPISEDIYAPVLAALEEEGIKFDETLRLDHSNDEEGVV